MQLSSHFQDDFPFRTYKVLYSVIQFSGTNTTTYITGFELHCFFHRVNNRVLLHVCPRPAVSDELGTGKQRWDQFHNLCFMPLNSQAVVITLNRHQENTIRI